MKILLLLFFTLLSFQCYGQSNIRYWETGQLTWDDFKGDPSFSSSYASELGYQLGYFSTKKRIENTNYYVYQTRNYINQNISWVKASEKSSQLLQYNQVIFNILELYRRQLQSELHSVSTGYMAREKFNTIYQNSKSEVGQFQSDTRNGTNEKALDFWDNLIVERLKENPIELIPETTDRNFGIGLNAGFGGGMLTGSLSDLFTPTFNFMFGFDIAFKNTILFLNGTLARDRVRREFTLEGLDWANNLKTNVAVIDFSVGQTFFENEKHKLTPFAGLGILEFSAAMSEGDEFDEHRALNYGLLFGLNYDFKLRNIIRLTPSRYSFGSKERMEHNIRVKLYVTTAEFENMGGASINLTVGYSLFGKMVRVKQKIPIW